jgi:hypothetical protein
MKPQEMQTTVFTPQVNAALDTIKTLRARQNPPTRISVSFKAGPNGDLTKHKINVTPDNGPPQGDDFVADIPDTVTTDNAIRLWLYRRCATRFIPDETDPTAQPDVTVFRF